MDPKERKNLDLSGIGSASGGTYQNLNVQGVGKVHGDVDCVLCQVEGVVEVDGNVKVQTMHIRGKAKIKGHVVGEDVKIDGKITIAGNCEAEMFYAAGAFVIDGLLNAGQITIRLYGPAQVKEIGGGQIRVERGPRSGLFSRGKKLSVEIVEGDDIHLEYTKARTVRGNKVSIGPGCEVGLVEYRTDFQQAKEAKITASQRL